MSDGRETRHHSAPVWGIFLLFLGVVFLLQTAGVLPWGLWQTLGNLWPVLIIVLGVAILLRHFNAWFVGLLIAAIFAATLGVAIWQYQTVPTGAMTTVYSQPVSGSTQATVILQLNASNVTVETLQRDSTNLVEVASTLTNTKDALDTSLDRNGNTARLTLNVNPFPTQAGNVRWIIRLAQGVPIDLAVTGNASTVRLSLVSATVNSIQLEGNASNLTADLPSLPPQATVNTGIKANASNIEITIPEGQHASVQSHDTLSSVNIASRFLMGSDSPSSSSGNGSVYVITVEANVSHVQIH